MRLKPMQRRLTLTITCAALLAGGCAVHPDRFYTLETLPAAPSPPPKPARQPMHVRLDVVLPSLVDRAELIVNTSANGIEILDHERWAAPLADQVFATLARDLEAQRGDLLVGDRGFERNGVPHPSIKVDIVRMTARRGAVAAIEVHWRIVDPAAALDSLGAASFEAPVGSDGYAAVARAYSDTLSALAQRLSAELPAL